MSLILTTEQLEQLIAQARHDAPNETCGIITGKQGRALKIYALKNIDPDPRIRYNVDPLELLNALHETEDLGREHLAIYHSHPASPAYPSPTDIARAFYPEVVYVLISLMNPELAMMRGFHIVDGQVEEIVIEIEDKDESPRTNPRRPARPTGRPRAGRAVAPLSKRRPAGGKTRRARR
jgi:[CysO sulfur-carrier protein]-S-L-cysteine hydrolase